MPLGKHILLCMCLRMETPCIRLNACLTLIQTANERSKVSALINYPTSITVSVVPHLLQHLELSPEIVVLLCNS